MLSRENQPEFDFGIPRRRTYGFTIPEDSEKGFDRFDVLGLMDKKMLHVDIANPCALCVNNRNCSTYYFHKGKIIDKKLCTMDALSCPKLAAFLEFGIKIRRIEEENHCVARDFETVIAKKPRDLFPAALAKKDAAIQRNGRGEVRRIVSASAKAAADKPLYSR